MKKILPLIVIASLWLMHTPAAADIAPPATPPGANLEPGSETTQVRMVAETVIIEVLGNTPEGSLGRAQVTADFTMRNMGTQSESMEARFPISASDGWSQIVEISNFQVQINDKSTPTRQIMGKDPYFGSGQVPWAAFDVTFPPGQDVSIRATYALEGMGEYPFVSFRYILTTGAGWKDSIGKADLIVRLPYDVEPENVIMNEHIGWSMTTPGASLVGREVRWSYTDLEPTYEHDLDIALVMPSAWKSVLNERANITKNPKDGEAWGRLGKLYKEMAFLRKSMRADSGGKSLYDLSVEAYQECLRLLPEDALWHAGFAELLYWHNILETKYKDPGDNSDIVRALEELNRALQINPKTTKALELLEEMSYGVPEAVQKDGEDYVLLFLTQTPQPVEPTITTVPQAVASATTLPGVTPQATAVPPTETPVSGSGNGGTRACGAMALTPLALLLPAVLRRRSINRQA